MPLGRMVGLGFVMVMAVACVAPSRADELGSKLAVELDKVKKGLFDAQGVSRVAVGEFTAAASLGASGGAGIGNSVIDAIRMLGMVVDKKASHEITGRYSRGVEPRSGLASLQVKFKVVETANDLALAEFTVQVVDAAAIMRLAGGSGDISGNRKEASRKVLENLDTPRVDVRSRPGAAVPNTRIASDPSSPYAVEVLLKRDDRDYLPRTSTVIEGQAFVPMKIRDVYAVRLINDSDQAAAVVLSVDGVSMFAFADRPQDRESRLVINARDSALIVGWYRNDGSLGSNEFLVGNRGEAAALKLLPESSARIGMITATFAVAWPKGTLPPEAETHDDRPGTVLGKPIGQPFRKVEFDIARPRNVVTVRYDKTIEPDGRPR